MFKLVVSSLFSNSSMGLIQSNSLRQHHVSCNIQPKLPNPFSSVIATSSITYDGNIVYNKFSWKNRSMTKERRKGSTRHLPFLPERKKRSCLDRTSEYRRISQLEKDMVLSPKYRRAGVGPGSPLLLSVWR